MNRFVVKFQLLILLLIALLITTANGQSPKSLERILALTNATIIDGNGGRPQPRKTIIIFGGRIADIFTTGKKKLPADATVMDLSGQYVIPGLIDSHYHLLLNRGAAEEMARHRFAFLGGVTAVRDMHGLPSGEAAWARAIKPDTDIVKVVTEAKKTGATGIKMYADLSPEVVARITKEAHRQGLKVWSHAIIFPSKPSDAVSAGVDVISHSVDLLYEFLKDIPKTTDTRPKDFYKNIDWDKFPIESPIIAALFRRMKKQGTILDATVTHTHTRFVLRQLARPEAERTIRDPQWMDDFTFGVTRRAHELGVLLVAGTDFQEAPRNQDFPNIHTELELLVTKCGLTPIEAITTATRNGAIALGIEKSYGTIARGKIADLVILSADPSIDIGNTTKIVYVIKGGKLHKREKVSMPAT
ncbi:MAG: amidohydrolase family protein [Acidobacteria bacterium]|nr:amidohydrolase family protein [Acidobacteriota bacterium]